MSVLNWVIITLIIMVWLQFALRKDSTFDSQISVNSKKSFTASQNIESIAQYHIFGSAQQLYETPLNQGQTSLDLVLNGTMSKVDEKSGIAYISNNLGEQKKFKVGDSVFNLATLKAVYKSHVILDHNGNSEQLGLSEKVQSSIATNKPKATQNKKKPGYLKHLNGSEQRNWQDLMKQQQFDPGKISKIVSNVNLVTDQTGQIQGLRVSNLAQGDMLTKHGLKSNDIITAINGNKVSAKNMLTIKQTLQQNPNATVTIKRNGKIQNVKISLNDI